MARGKYYTDEENAKLIALIEDNPDAKFVEISDKAQRYGICSNRNRDALAGHISELYKAIHDETEEDDIEYNEEFALVLVYEAKYKEYREKYEKVCDAVIGKATLFENNPNTLKLNFPAIRDWMYTCESQRVLAQIESLQTANKEDN